ncbi:MAG: VOC family protein [Acidobacteria bacterium]|nr:VOC family protein [Acidobacteriota bacterium]
MSEVFRLAKIGVVMLGVSDMATSKAFYVDTLGLELSGEHGGFCFLQAGGVTLALSKELGPPSGERSGVEVVFSVEHVREAHEGLKAKGVEFRIAARVVAGPMWATDFRDPDGHVLSIFGPE